MTRTTRLHAATLATLAALLLPAVASAQQDDTALFTSAVPPNVMLLVDNSGSMNNIVWHPAFNPTATPTCVYGGFAQNDVTYTFSSTFTTTQCGNTRTLYADTAIDGSTRILGRYLNWYFSNAATPYFKPVANTDADNLQSLTNGQRSQCLIDEGLPATYSRYRRSRITAAKEVLREVICQVNQAGTVRFGLAQFFASADPLGGFVKVPIADYTPAQGALIDDFIDDLNAEAWTPLAESLYNVYRYFQSRTLPALGVNGVAFPAYALTTTGATSAASAPPTPVQEECQKNFVVIITDGEPTKDDFTSMPGSFATLVGNYNTDDTSPEAGNENPGDACAYCNKTAFYLDDLAKFMQEHDFQRDFAGEQLIDVYTIGFTTSPDANALLQKTANVGNGIFRSSNNAEELAAVIIEQVLDIVDKSQSFTSATVPASRTTDGDSFYSSFFRPKRDTAFWEGHLKSFKFTVTGDILTADDKCAVGSDTLSPPCPTSGLLLTESNAVWDAAEEVPAPINRNARTGTSSLAFGSAAQRWFLNSSGVVTHNQTRDTLGLTTAPPSELAKAPFSLPNPNTTAQLDALVPKLVSQIAGCKFPTLLGAGCVIRTNADGDQVLLGDIFHSNPVIVDSPNAPINDLAYKQFANQYRQRDRLIYAGSNDGWLHGFHAGDWDTALSPPRHDRGTGTEIVAFMPSEVRKNIWSLPISQPFGSIRRYAAVDGSAVAADVWIYRDVNPLTQQLTTTLLPNATTRVKEQWRTVLIGGLRGGGRSFYALDVTDPSDTANFPRYLWDFPCQTCGVAVNPDGGNAIATGGATPQQLAGYSWSEPVITRVKVRVDGDTVGYRERWVAVMGGGYDACGDPNSLTYFQQAIGEACDSTNVNKYAHGRALFMVDITTGKLLAVKAFNLVSLSTNGGQVGDPRLKYAFASQPAVFDIDFDGFADVIYIGDLGGNLWKWVVSPVGDDPINNSTANKSLGQPDWPFELFFHANHSDESFTSPPTGTATDASHFQSFFFPPTAVKKGTSLVLAWGAGERADTQAGTIDAVADTYLDTNNNHYYVVKDEAPEDLSGTTATLYEADLVPISELDDGTIACINVVKGYFLTGRDREKFITNSVVFLGDVITGSYLPADPSAGACEASGQAYLYRFDLECGTGDPNASGSPDDQRRRLIGGGLPTRPRVSVGDLNTGGQSTGCNNKVVLITSDGAIENDCPGSLDSSGINVRTWRER